MNWPINAAHFTHALLGTVEESTYAQNLSAHFLNPTKEEVFQNSIELSTQPQRDNFPSWYEASVLFNRFSKTESRQFRASETDGLREITQYF